VEDIDDDIDDDIEHIPTAFDDIDGDFTLLGGLLIDSARSRINSLVY
jgi:hypothetical protein